jgi:hypothetical protein
MQKLRNEVTAMCANDFAPSRQRLRKMNYDLQGSGFLERDKAYTTLQPKFLYIKGSII